MSGSESQPGLVVAVIGAMGAVGKDLVRGLQKAPFPIASLRLFGRRGGASELELEGDQLDVLPMPGQLSADGPFAGVDLVFLATPPEVSRELGPALAGLGIGVVDIGAALSDRAPLAVPAIGVDGLSGFSEGRVVCSPSAPVVALATLLYPLIELGAISVRGTLMLSAGLAGHAGVEELSAQVTALFNGGTPPRQIFPSGLAFDLVAPVGPTQAGGLGWSDTELQIAVHSASLLGLEPHQIAVSAALIPTFVGLALSLYVEFDDELSLSAAREALEAVPGVRVGDPVPGPRRLAGRAGLYVGRLRVDPAGRGLHLWAAADNLRFGATANAIGIASALVRSGRL